MEGITRADQVLARLLPDALVDRDKLIRFCAAWAKGERKVMDLVRSSGISMPTVRRYRTLLAEAEPTAANAAPTKLEQVNTIGQGLRDAADQGLWADVSRLSAELSKLTGRYEPERKETVVRHYLSRAGGPEAIDKEILEAQAELDKLSGGQAIEDAEFEDTQGGQGLNPTPKTRPSSAVRAVANQRGR